MNKKRVTFFIGTMGNGGAQRVISLIAPKMVEKGIAVTVLTYYNQQPFYDIDKGIQFTTIIGHTKTSSIIKNILYLRHYIMNNTDVVISFLAPFNMMVLLATIGTGIPIIVADRNDPTQVPTNGLVRLLRNILYNRSSAIVTQTNNNAKYFLCNCRRPVRVISNPVNHNPAFEQGPKTKKKNTIVTMGRLTGQKNHEMLIKAFYRFLMIKDDYQLVIYGEGENRKRLETLVSELGISQNVILPGSKKNVLELITTAKVFVLTSDYEGMPNALIEAMCVGLPVISTKVSGAEDLIVDGYNGFLIEKNDVDALFNHFCRIDKDYNQYNQLGINAIKIHEQLDLDRIVEQWQEIIEDIRH